MGKYTWLDRLQDLKNEIGTVGFIALFLGVVVVLSFIFSVFS